MYGYDSSHTEESLLGHGRESSPLHPGETKIGSKQPQAAQTPFAKMAYTPHRPRPSDTFLLTQVFSRDFRSLVWESVLLLWTGSYAGECFGEDFFFDVGNDIRGNVWGLYFCFSCGVPDFSRLPKLNPHESQVFPYEWAGLVGEMAGENYSNIFASQKLKYRLKVSKNNGEQLLRTTKKE